VQGGLPVEDDEVAVSDVSFHLVAALQVEVGGLRVEAQVDSLAVVADDILGARVLRVASPDQLLHPENAADIASNDGQTINIAQSHLLPDQNHSLIFP